MKIELNTSFNWDVVSYDSIETRNWSKWKKKLQKKKQKEKEYHISVIYSQHSLFSFYHIRFRNLTSLAASNVKQKLLFTTTTIYYTYVVFRHNSHITYYATHFLMKLYDGNVHMTLIIKMLFFWLTLFSCVWILFYAILNSKALLVIYSKRNTRISNTFIWNNFQPLWIASWLLNEMNVFFCFCFIGTFSILNEKRKKNMKLSYGNRMI